MHVEATPEEAGLRADVWLHRRLPDLSRSRIQALLKTGCILCAGSPVKAHHKVTVGLAVDVNVPAAAEPELRGEAIPLDVLYEDAQIVVINKPPGLVVHPSAGHEAGTLVNALLHHCGDLAGIGGERRPGIVHRLDKDTSGAMVAAKTDQAMAALTGQFKRGRVEKEYVAIVHGTPHPAQGTVDTLIGRSAHDRKRMSATPARGRRAVTHYAVAERCGDYSVLRVRIETGRTHQIRVHLSHIGHPVLGDRQYAPRRRHTVGGRDVPRQMLHAAKLSLDHPSSGERLVFTAPLPADLLAALDELRRSLA